MYDPEGYVSWLNQFRGCNVPDVVSFQQPRTNGAPVYSYPEAIVLTGVSHYNDPVRGAFIAPPDPSARWDDPAGYDHPDEDEFEVMGQSEVNGKRGFVFHHACWSLWEHKKLFKVCGSLPIHRLCRIF